MLSPGGPVASGATAVPPPADARPLRQGASLRATATRHWLLGLGLAAIILPTFADVARDSWSTEQGAHGPVVLATGIWLTLRMRPSFEPLIAPGSPLGAAVALIVSLAVYALGRISGTTEMEGFALYAALLSITYAYIGRRAMRAAWFPILYFAFLFPPPDSLVAAVTQPLKLGISRTAVDLLNWCGLTVARTGVIIQVDQYDILVAAACAGLNSIISLSAIGLFYIYIRHNANWRYALLLMFAIVPVAVVANFVRVVLLILITAFFGDAVAQGFLHGFAGMTMFTVALLGIFAIDMLASPLRRRLAGGGRRMTAMTDTPTEATPTDLRPSRRDLLVGAACLGVAGFAFARTPRRRLASIPTGKLPALAPDTVGDWHYATASGIVLPPPDELARLLYDQQVSKAYASDRQPPVMMVMAYGSSQGGMLQVHRPEICYPASGFRLSETSTRLLALGDGRTLPVRSFTATADTRTEHVIYWTRIGNALPTSWTAQRIAIMKSNLEGAVPDGLLVRLSTVDEAGPMAKEALESFVRALLASVGPAGRRQLLGTAAS